MPEPPRIVPEIVYLEANLHGQPGFARMEAYRGAKNAQDLGLRPDIAGGLSQIVPEIVYLRANVRNPWQLAIEVAVHVCRCPSRGLVTPKRRTRIDASSVTALPP